MSTRMEQINALFDAGNHSWIEATRIVDELNESINGIADANTRVAIKYLRDYIVELSPQAKGAE